MHAAAARVCGHGSERGRCGDGDDGHVSSMRQLLPGVRVQDGRGEDGVRHGLWPCRGGCTLTLARGDGHTGWSMHAAAAHVGRNGGGPDVCGHGDDGIGASMRQLLHGVCVEDGRGEDGVRDGVRRWPGGGGCTRTAGVQRNVQDCAGHALPRLLTRLHTGNTCTGCATRAQPLHSVAEIVQSTARVLTHCGLPAAAPDRRRLRECDAASHSRHVRPERPQEETAVKDRRAGNRHCCACAHFPPCEPHWRRRGRAVLIWIRMRFAVTPCR